MIDSRELLKNYHTDFEEVYNKALLEAIEHVNKSESFSTQEVQISSKLAFH